MPFSKRSLSMMKNIHPDLRKVMDAAMHIVDLHKEERATFPDFTVVEGMRSIQRQHELYAQKATKTLNSRHLTGHAVDIVPLTFDGKADFAWPRYDLLASIVKMASDQVGVPIQWGGDWKTFKDGPHWELPWKEYPILQGRLKV